jgi:hypothetical protein
MQVDCDYDVKESDDASSENTVIPIPQLVRVTQFSEIIILWNTDMSPPVNLAILSKPNEETGEYPIVIDITAGSEYSE